MQEYGQPRNSSLSLTADADDGNSVYRISLGTDSFSIGARLIPRRADAEMIRFAKY